MINGEIKVFLVDDHPVVLEGLTSGLKQYSGISIEGAALSVKEAREKLINGNYDLIVVDLNLPEVEDGFTLLRHISSSCPDSKIIVLSNSNSPKVIFEANQAGAHAYLIKDCGLDEIAEAFFIVHAGGRPPLKPELEAALWEKLRKVPADGHPYDLNEREWRILKFMTGGATNDTIAQRLFVSARVVRRCNTSIYEKLGVRNRSEAIALALREKLFD